MESSDFSSIQETDSGSLGNPSNTNFCLSVPPSVRNVLNVTNQSRTGQQEGEISHPNENSENGVGAPGGRAMVNTVLPATPPGHQYSTATDKSRAGTSQSSILPKSDINQELRPKYPNLASYDARIATFSNWPSTNVVTKERLAEGGLFFTGESDITRCFYCGESLRTWEPGDDPILQHLHWFQNCENAQRLQRERHENHISGQADQAIEPECGATGRVNVPDPMESDAAKAVLFMGYAPKTVKDALAKLMEDNGNVTVAGDSLVTFILDEEEKKIPAINNQSLLNEFKELKEKEKCQICLDNMRDATLLPCGHFFCCIRCAGKLNACPICRTWINGIVKTYFS